MPGSVLRVLVPAVMFATAVGAQVVRAPSPCDSPCPPNAMCATIRNCAPPTAQVVRSSSQVRVDLEGRVVRYEVTDTYINRGTIVGEADYLLPLPKGAAFEDMALSINGEMVTGETMGADRARAVYEEIVRRMRDPALVEWMGHGLLRTRIFPIQPGETKRVVARFRAVAEREGDAWRVDWLGPTRTASVAGATEQSYTVSYPDDGSFGDAYSPTHTLRTTREGGRKVARAQGGQTALTVLLPTRTHGNAALSVLAHAPSGEDGYALISLSPPTRATRATARDVVFVVDVSGSMSGQKMEQARAAGRQFLRSLAPSDRFRLIDFSSDVRSFRDGWTAATRDNVRDALAYVDGLRANGGTNILGALEEALRAPAASGRLPLVLFLTDGEATVGETRPDAIVRRAGELRLERRVFTFGIGADVNAGLLEQLALEGRGTATFVRPEESVERAVGVVSERLTNPVATDVELHADGVRLYSMEPNRSIDLFAGQDLVVLARYAGARDVATLTVDGRTPDGPVHWSTRVTFPSRTADNAFVARLWAVQRVGFLSAARRRSGANTEIDTELRQLGERYGIPTELTSYLVREPATALTANRSDAARLRTQGGVGAAMPAPVSQDAARASTAVDRFESAKVAAEQRATTTLGALDARQEREANGGVRSAGTHTFRLTNGVWQDERTVGNGRQVKIRAFSPAYFALIKRMPELAPFFAVGEKVRVQGRRVTIEVSEDGVTQLDAAVLESIVADW